MKRSIGRLGKHAFIAAMLLVATGHVARAEVLCTVADPTGTPLNVRAEPNGSVVMTLSNGARLSRAGERNLKGKSWSLVADETGKLGWVFSAYLDCASVNRDQQKSAPMRPRPTGN